jgi:hypothetical protein
VDDMGVQGLDGTSDGWTCVRKKDGVHDPNGCSRQDKIHPCLHEATQITRTTVPRSSLTRALCNPTRVYCTVELFYIFARGDHYDTTQTTKVKVKKKTDHQGGIVYFFFKPCSHTHDDRTVGRERKNGSNLTR